MMIVERLSGPRIGAARAPAGASRPGGTGGSLPLLVVRLRGSQEEMGEQHGRLLRGLGGYEPALAFYPEMPSRLLFGDMPFLGMLAAPALDALLRRLERDRPAAFLARTRAFLEGLGRPREASRFVLVMDLFQNLVSLAARLGFVPFAKRMAACAPPACSTLAAWGRSTADGRLRHARNFDFPGIGVWDLAPAVVFCDPDDGLRYGFATTRGGDTPGVSAFNEAGIAFTAHTRLHYDVAFSGAAIIDLGHEIVRRAETLEEAIRIVRARPIASTWGLAISSARERRAVSVETTGRDVAVLEPAAGDDFVVTTNHYRDPALRRREVLVCAAWRVHSEGRARRLAEAARAGGLGSEALEALLGDHRDPEDPTGAERAAGSTLCQAATVQSVVIDAEGREIRVTTGRCPASFGPWTAVRWSWDGEVGAEEVAPDARWSARPSRFAEGAAAEAYSLFVEATKILMAEHDVRAASAALERAVALDPEEPRYRFGAGALELRLGAPWRALEHFERGLVREGAPFRRANLALWASRAAEACGDRERAARLRAQVLAIENPCAAELRKDARAEQERPYDPRGFKRIQVNLLTLDVQ